MIPKDFVHTLLNRVDIVDVVENYVPLKRSGSNYVACCPFHTEKTPSFTVSQSKQFYHCFGCGAHGTAIGFLMEFSGGGFVEAVRQLAESAGMVVPEEQWKVRSEQPTATDLGAVMMQALDYYRSQLKQSTTAITYLKHRGLTGKIAARFGIGYAPPGWQNLAAAFPDYNDPGLVDCGLVIQNEEGRRFDRFRDRVMFPILSMRGEVIGFGGRVISAGEPKYLNSPETALFQKGQELYGLPQARRAIRANGRVLVVEGYMDVVALAQNGIEYSVATLGTATSAIHVQRCLRLAENVIFCFDGDDAGRKAAWRALEVSLPHLEDGKNVSFLLLPTGEDPDSYVRRYGKEGFDQILGTALPLSTYVLQELARGLDLKTEEGRARCLQAGKTMLAQVTAPMLGLLLRKRLAELTGLDQEEMKALLGVRSGAPLKPLARVPRKPPSLERRLLAGLMYRSELARECEVVFPEPVEGDLRSLAAVLEFLRGNPHIHSLAAILEQFRGTEHEPVLSELSAEMLQLFDGFDAVEIGQEYRDGIAQLRKKALRQQMEALNSKARTEGLTTQEMQRYQTLVEGRI